MSVKIFFWCLCFFLFYYKAVDSKCLKKPNHELLFDGDGSKYLIASSTNNLADCEKKCDREVDT